MNMHTPGPWNFYPCDEDVNSFDVLCEKDYFVATTHDGVRGDRNADANARLIAAAPDLLEALQVMVRDYGAAHASCGGLEMAPALFQAQRAIAKATGDQP